MVWKDIKLRTFISDGAERNDLAAHVYDITYGSVVPFKDNLVVIDDSIVRGTTLRESIFKILHRLHPKKIVMVSSSPQIRYPDYYGIDMSRLEELCAFRAAIALIQERGMQKVIADVYRKCKDNPMAENHVLRCYSLKGCSRPLNWFTRASKACMKLANTIRAIGISPAITLRQAAFVW